MLLHLLYLAYTYDKDCLEDLRVYLPRYAQELVDKAINVKCRRAELIWVYIDVESVSFNRGFYTVDVKYFYKVTVDVFTGVRAPTEVSGLATFDKRVILFGSEGNAKIFSSKANLDGLDKQMPRKANMPTAVVESMEYKLTVTRAGGMEKSSRPIFFTCCTV